MRWYRLVVPLVLFMMGFGAVAGVATAREVKDKGPFAAVPRLGAARPPTFVGVDSAGRAVAVAFTGEHEVVAYVCDGDKTGVWFRGTFAGDATTAALKGKKGASLTLDLTADPLSGTVTIGGTDETFTVVPAGSGAGLYREQHGALLSGWIIDNTGVIVGVTQDESGKVVNTVSTGAPSSSPPDGSSSGSDAGGPVATKFIQCALAQFRVERERKRIARTGQAGPQTVLELEQARDTVCGNA